MYPEQSIESFLEKLSAKSSTPGGGTASILSSLIGISLGLMAARFTKAREAEDVIEKLARIRTELLPLMDEDAKAYEQYKLKRDLESLKRSADIPLKGVELSIRALRIMQDFKPSCNKNLISDLLCGSIMVAAGANGCRLNVMVNINSMKDESLREEYKRILGRLEEELKGALGIEGLRFD